MKTRLVWFLPIGGLFYVVGVVARGPFANPLSDASQSLLSRKS
jgi:hypothetical protein